MDEEDNTPSQPDATPIDGDDDVSAIIAKPAAHGMIEHGQDGWKITEAGQAILDQATATRQ